MGRAPPPLDSLEAQEAAVLNGIDQYELQRSIITRLVKASLPAEVKLQKDVAGALSKCSTVFINYLASSAHETAVGRGVKTIGAQDVLGCLDYADLWADELRDELEEQLKAYRTYGPRRPEPRPKPIKSTPSEKSLKIKLTRPESAEGKGKEREGDDDEEDDDEEEEEEEEDEEEEDEDEDEDEEEEEQPGQIVVESVPQAAPEEGGGQMEVDP